MGVVCENSVKNITHGQCKGILGQIIGLWLDPENTGVTFANALLEATWIAKINAATDTRMYIPGINVLPDEVTRNVEEPVIQTGNTGKRTKVRNGKVDLAFRYDNITLDQVERLKTFDSWNGYAYFITRNGDIVGGSTATNLIPVNVDVYVGEAVSPENEDGLWSVTLYCYIIPTKDYFTKSVSPTAFDATLLTGIQDVTITIVSADVSDQTIIATISGVPDGNEISALTKAGDFLLTLASTGAAVTISGVTNVGYTYTFTTSGLTAALHNLTLSNQPTMTVKGYECQTAVAFTPVA